MKSLATGLFVLNTLLWASYYPVCKEVLSRFDPILFIFLDISVLMPAAVGLLALRWRQLNREAIRRGAISGALFALAVATTTLSLSYTTATNTGFLTGLDGLIAVMITVLVLRKKVSQVYWTIAGLSLLGVFLLIFESFDSGGNPVGDLLALLSGILFVAYLFRARGDTITGVADSLTVMAVQFSSAFIVAAVCLLPFVDWTISTPVMPGDALVILYIGICTTLVPAVITVVFSRHVSVITIGFVYVLEPVFVSLLAIGLLGEHLTSIAYVGGALIVFGSALDIAEENGYLKLVMQRRFGPKRSRMLVDN